jgi:hypothetical protein
MRTQSAISGEELQLILQLLLETSNDPKYSQVKAASAEVMEQLLHEAHLSSEKRDLLLGSADGVKAITRILANLSLSETPAVVLPFSKANQDWSKLKKVVR